MKFLIGRSQKIRRVTAETAILLSVLFSNTWVFLVEIYKSNLLMCSNDVFEHASVSGL